MFDPPNVYSPDKISVLFDYIAINDVPKKFTYRFLEQLGFKSSRDRELIPFLKKLLIIDEKGNPKEDYRILRDLTQNKQLVSEKVSVVYSELFDLDERSFKREDKILEGYFGRLTEKSVEEVKYLVQTFKALCTWSNYAIYTELLENENLQDNAKSKLKKVEREAPKLNLNITLPSTTDEKVYESLFKHLTSLLNPE
ncbi:DUF5343 domain-containing protein [Patescibacteria group bacterium]